MQDILTYFLHALAPSNLLVILTGTVVGIIVGALPGFTATAADDLQRIRRDGIAAAMEACRKEAAL